MVQIIHTHAAHGLNEPFRKDILFPCEPFFTKNFLTVNDIIIVSFFPFIFETVMIYVLVGISKESLITMNMRFK